MTSRNINTPNWLFKRLTDIQVVLKAANEIVNNSSVLQNDDELIFSVAANETWEFNLLILYNATTTPDLKYTFSIPAGATCYWHAVVQSGGVVQNAFEYVMSGKLADGQGDINGFTIKGVIVNGATAGSVQFRWAQYTANASDTTVYAGSHIIAHRLN